ncbi:Gfo/Idh/MocA family protein [Agriterribacter sp.]|uniref:Gfo/Idh/MocA family protein n=1 Tax=Agriterribacter sp. TaxID=2821509 RepID=UPI002C9418FD|nr:Gfo/Idh/MocA family oxidoreductase [Agriterribacter sp.]HTN08407.1 Gfo/Idh/MocA family oxidoreductase [Agriterribacter sp.]
MKKKYGRRNFIGTAIAGGIGLSLSNSFTALYAQGSASQKRIGIIGLDTSHSIAFTKALNAASASPELKGYKVVAAYPKGSNDIASSVKRIPEYTEEVKKLGVEIVSSIQELLKKTDFILLETNDGRLHLQQALEVIKAGKPMFIDKPIAASLKDAMAIFKAAEQYKVPVFSSSSLRFMQSAQEVAKGKVGKVLGADTYSPAHLENTHPDLFWYGIHGVETLYTVMGTGCKQVVRLHTNDTDVVAGTWEDGRIGTFRGTRSGKSGYGGTVFGENATTVLGPFDGYDALLVEIIQFFDTGIAPVSSKETLEICAFMEAADESKNKGGVPVSLEEMRRRAEG